MDDVNYGGFHLCIMCLMPVKDGTVCKCMKQETRYMETTRDSYYISGQMRGRKLYGFDAFKAVEDLLLARGYCVWNPHQMDLIAGFDVHKLPADHDWNSYPPGFDVKACHDRCYGAVQQCDAIYMLKGWRDSKGATAEHALAQWMGKRVVYEDDADYTWFNRGDSGQLEECGKRSFLDEIERELVGEALTEAHATIVRNQIKHAGAPSPWEQIIDHCSPQPKPSSSFLDEIEAEVLDAGVPCGCCGRVEPEGHDCFTEPSSKATNPKDAIGALKAKFSTIPAGVMFEIGLALLEGAVKYGRHNYRGVGVRASVYYDACMGHLADWWEGQDMDPDSGLNHVTKFLASGVVLRDAMLQGKLEDDRPPRSKVFKSDFNADAARIIEKHKDKNPKHWTIGDK